MKISVMGIVDYRGMNSVILYLPCQIGIGSILEALGNWSFSIVIPVSVPRKMRIKRVFFMEEFSWWINLKSFNKK